MKTDKRLRVVISGKVQGVFFRAHTKRKAQQFNVSGWVQNLPDGRVEICAEGEEDAVKSLVAWARKGPPTASVTAVHTEWLETTGETGFRIRY